MNLSRRVSRRRFVLALHLVFLPQVLALRAMALDQLPSGAAFALFLALQVAFFGGVVLLMRALRNVAMSGDCIGDERQAAVRLTAHRAAYTLLFALVMLGVIYCQLVTLAHAEGRLWLPRTGDDWMIVASLLGPLGITLPQSVLAWTEPDPPAEIDLEFPPHGGRLAAR